VTTAAVLVVGAAAAAAGAPAAPTTTTPATPASASAPAVTTRGTTAAVVGTAAATAGQRHNLDVLVLLMDDNRWCRFDFFDIIIIIIWILRVIAAIRRPLQQEAHNSRHQSSRHKQHDQQGDQERHTGVGIVLLRRCGGVVVFLENGAAASAAAACGQYWRRRSEEDNNDPQDYDVGRLAGFHDGRHRPGASKQVFRVDCQECRMTKLCVASRIAFGFVVSKRGRCAPDLSSRTPADRALFVPDPIELTLIIRARTVRSFTKLAGNAVDRIGSGWFLLLLLLEGWGFVLPIE
jgi:hypothetical protein